MSSGKRYYWLKLKEDFFTSKRVKKLRNMAGGDTYLIIYLKLQLKAMKTEGIIRFDHLEENIADELALDLDENPDDIRATLIYLTSCGLAETSDTEQFFFPYAIENVGSENSSAARVREYRAKQKALHCNNNETQVKRLRNGEIETEIETETEIEKEREKETEADGGGEQRDGFMSDEEARRIAEEQNEILDAAENAGFNQDNATRGKLINLYAEFGKERVLECIDICVNRGKISPGYLKGCLTREEKKRTGNPFMDAIGDEEDPLYPPDHVYYPPEVLYGE